MTFTKAQQKKNLLKHQDHRKRIKELELMFKVLDQRTRALTKTMINFSEEIRK